jgi:hypothetical protein
MKISCYSTLSGSEKKTSILSSSEQSLHVIISALKITSIFMLEVYSLEKSLQNMHFS